MASTRSGFFALATAVASASMAAAATCDTSTLNTTSYLYPITVANTTIQDVADATGRGLCNIGRYNFMADVVCPPPPPPTPSPRFSFSLLNAASPPPKKTRLTPLPPT